MSPNHPGYVFHPSTHISDLGYGKVEIYIGAKPLERFFDTCRAVFPVAEDGILSDLVVDHPWLSDHAANPRHVCAGRFHLYENDGDEHLGFSLGGELDVRQDENWVICQLISPAPIFNLSEVPGSTNHWLADELEGLLARRRASYGEDDSRFAERLQLADPVSLFIAALATMERDIHAFPVAVRSNYQHQYNAIKHAIHILDEADEWPDIPPLLESLL